jgi:hypothetical protein
MLLWPNDVYEKHWGAPRESSNPFQDIRTLRENGWPHQNKDNLHGYMQGERGRIKEGPKKQMKNGRDLLRQQESHGNGAKLIISAGVG